MDFSPSTHTHIQHTSEEINFCHILLSNEQKLKPNIKHNNQSEQARKEKSVMMKWKACTH